MLHVTIELCASRFIERPIVNEYLGEFSLIEGCRFFRTRSLGVLPECEMADAGNVAEPIALIGAGKTTSRFRSLTVREELPRLSVTIDERTMELAVVGFSLLKNVVVADPSTHRLESEPRVRFESFLKLGGQLGKLFIGDGHLTIQFGGLGGCPLSLVFSIEVCRNRSANLKPVTPFRCRNGNRREEGLHSIEVASRNVVVFVVVTFGTAHGQAKKNGGDG